MASLPYRAPAIKISVVACTYNGEAYIAEQLSTILAQSRIPDEIVISDDASGDGTWGLLESFAANARTRGIDVSLVRRHERLGYVRNFSEALTLANGDVIFLCDQDDAWHPDKVDTMLAAFEGEPETMFVHSDARLVDAHGSDLGNGLFEALEVTESERSSVAGGKSFSVYLRRNLATGAASAFRRELLDVALPLPTAWVHDAWLATLAAATGQIVILDDPLIDYRQHAANQIGMSPRRTGQRLADMFRSSGRLIHDDVVRLDILMERLRQARVSTEHIRLAGSMRDHLQVRLSLGDRPRWCRLPTIAREWSTGRYTRFGTGIRSALRDLLRVG
ncbi:glycosyltransferase family 2 protein [Dyella sp. 333MFSha]|uniref:glycosyltransferase family 2 protein n=1 Tax=Dyella sp. 333MFSha TaxID=1798240 RepID=UPI00088CF2E2|nr:glycosyltransferase family 2 protein [Dyella sp. 333MFSha]SDG46962.1 Glycosyltransferase involved in cell wall bisynthesis [Dyella sp. 333MFSha]